MYINFLTFGCKVNTYETAAMSEALENAGFSITDDKSITDIFVINSCTVTSESDNKLFQTLRKLKREYPDAVTVLTGCYPQAFPDSAAPLADIVIGTKNRNRLPHIINEFLKGHKPVAAVEEYAHHDCFEKMTVSHVDGHTRAFVKIQDGCNSFCTYCIIPYSRGRIRSKPVEEIKSEIRLLAENGYREVVLVGINLAFYGSEWGLTLADAVEAACSVEGICRVRLGSLEPEKITDSDLERFAALPAFCPSFHLSLQSGCDRILEAMNRKYTSDDFRCLCEKIRKRFPDCGITADVMVGFPGETEDDHEVSVSFVKSIGFSDVHVFPYSRRKGTRADMMDGQVPQDIKKRRAREMTEICSASRTKFLESLVGKVVPVLFEREKNDGIHHGFSPNYTNIKILTKNSEKSLRKMIFYVKIDKIGHDCCWGHILPERCNKSDNI